MPDLRVLRALEMWVRGRLVIEGVEVLGTPGTKVLPSCWCDVSTQDRVEAAKDSKGLAVGVRGLLRETSACYCCQ